MARYLVAKLALGAVAAAGASSGSLWSPGMIWDHDPIAFVVLGWPVRWYGLSYLFGLLLTFWLGYPAQKKLFIHSLSRSQWLDFLSLILLWGIVGGRLGEFLFYQFDTLQQDPLELFRIWNGGMAIHGGLLGALGYLAWWVQQNKEKLISVTGTLVGPLALALGFGRVANYLNGELVGAPTKADWGIIFPHIDTILRHPTQLYEAGYSFLLAGILAILWHTKIRHPRLLTQIFLIGYGGFRFIVEFWKTGPSWGVLSVGQWLCLGMILAGVGLFCTPSRR